MSLSACAASSQSVSQPAATSLPATTQAAAAPRILIRDRWLLQDASKVAATGDVVSHADFDTRGWHKAVVPGTVLTSLVADGTYPDPLYGLNNNAIPESLSRTNWWYRTQIDGLPRDGQKHFLHFDGVNYVAEVWLNGTPLGVIRGAFGRADFDVTAILKPQQSNVLAILILPQPHPGVTHQKSQAGGTGPNGGITATDGPTFLCSLGWDWIPTIRDRDSGIWQDVSLITSGPVRIENPFVQSKLPLPRTDSADLTVQATLRNETDLPQSGTLEGVIDQDRSFRQSVSLEPRESKTITFRPTDTPDLHWDHPKLWWPNGFGEPNLHPLHLSFSDSHGQSSDVSDCKFGVREISYSVPGSENLTLVVNGVPVMAKGGDWGMDEALKRVPPERLDAMVRMHQQANCTIIRNWVGQSTEDAFYDACDRYGILIWDEMFQPNPSDGPNPIDTPLYLANIKEKLLRYRNHPSIALWCGRNEGDPPPEIHRGIAELIHQYDESRLFQASSTDGRGVHSGGPYYWRVPREYYNVDAPFKTELGSMSIPTFEAVLAMLPEQSRHVIDEVWAERDFCAGAQRGDLFPHEIAERYGGFSNLADFIRKGQLATYEAYRAMYEGRFAKLFQPASGVITWMSCPAQPSFVWQLYTHDLEPNAALFATRKACEPLHVQINQTNWHVMVINNQPTTQPHLNVTARVYNLDGSLHQTVGHVVDAAASAATDVGEMKFDSGVSPVHFVRLDLTDEAKKPLSQNLYWRGVDDDDLTALDSLPQANLSVKAQRENDPTECRVRVTLKNTANVIALMTHLQLRDAASGQRILPVFYDDNYLSLLPGESRELAIRAPLSVVQDKKLQLALDGWNIGLDSARGGSEVAVVLNTDALARSLAASTQPAESEGALRIHCGGPRTTPIEFGKPIEAPGVFERDIFFRGGTMSVDDTPVLPDPAAPAPASLYTSSRRGQAMYDLPIKADRSYTIRLHFADPQVDGGSRKFNVLINEQLMLKEFDIAAEAGRGRALVKTFRGVRSDTGHLRIALRRGSAGEPTICGIEVVPESLAPTTVPTSRPWMD